MPIQPLPPARAPLLALGALLLGACRSSRDFALVAAARALPEAGPGVSLALEQRVGSTGSLDLGFTLGFEQVPLDEQGPLGDEWKRAFAGLTVRGKDAFGLHAAGGITWVRTDAEVQGVETFGDYGGAYLETGYDWRLAPALSTGPLVTGAWVDSEGDRAGSGSFVEFAWRFAWRF